MKPNEIRAAYAINCKKIKHTANRLNIAGPCVHQVINGQRTTRYIQEAISEDIGQPYDQVFPVTKEET